MQNRILLFKRGALGDLLMATPLIRQLAKHNFTLDIVVGKSAVTAIKDNPYLNQIMVWEDNIFTLSGCWQLARKLIKLRAHNYAYVFVLDKHWYFNLMVQLVGTKVIGYNRGYLSSLCLVQSIHYHNVNRYHGLYYLDLIKPLQLAIDYDDLKLDLFISLTDQQIVDKILLNLNLLKQDFVVIVNSGGNNSFEQNGLRMLPRQLFIDLVSYLLEQDYKIILLGSDLDYNYYQQTLPANSNLFNLAGSLNLAQSAELIKRSYHFYTTDCGAMHLGVAVDHLAQMTAFFGPTNPKHILPEYSVVNIAYWQDQQIYSPNYQLNGKQRKPEPQYFTQLIMTKFLAEKQV